VKVATDFYKNLFRQESRWHFLVAESLWGQVDLVTREENDELVAPFTEAEIREVVFSSCPEGAPGPDGLPFLFYQRFWGIIKHDLMNMFSDFQNRGMDLFRLNFAMLTLIPKVEDAADMKLFRPISLWTLVLKILVRLSP
jgi:hypothetical protein